MDNSGRQAIIDELGLSIQAAFVPFSESRHAKPSPKLDDLSLNWRVTLRHNGRDVLTCDYSAGIAHCPSYDRSHPLWKQSPTTLMAENIRKECELGHTADKDGYIIRGKPILPDTLDVLASLASDSDALDYPTYEQWAPELGYDPDSRKGEMIYRQCLQTALSIRAAIGESGLTRLRDAFVDY